MFAPRVLVGNRPDAAAIPSIIARASAEMMRGASAMEAASAAYGEAGLPLEPQERRYLFTHFVLHDSTGGDILSRRPQEPARAMAVYSMFGGTGVITPR